MSYRISRRGPGHFIEASFDGARWLQLRVAHVHKQAEAVLAGVYACSPSPVGKAFRCLYTEVTIGESAWAK